MKEAWTLNVGILKSNEAWWLPEAGKSGHGSLVFNGYRVQFRKIKKFWRWMMVIVSE